VRIASPNEAPEQGRLLCKACGRAIRFSADGRFVIYQREATVQTDPKRKLTASLMEADSGKERPWLEHPSDSIVSVSTFADNLAYAIVRVSSPGTQRTKAVYVVPWREEPVRFNEWIEVKELADNDNYSANGNTIEFVKNQQLMEMRFDLATRSFSAPYPVKLVAAFAPALMPNSWILRDAGLVFTSRETASSVWLMKMSQ
jgi:hypothetical protein